MSSLCGASAKCLTVAWTILSMFATCRWENQLRTDINWMPFDAEEVATICKV